MVQQPRPAGLSPGRGQVLSWEKAQLRWCLRLAPQLKDVMQKSWELLQDMQPPRTLIELRMAALIRWGPLQPCKWQFVTQDSPPIRSTPSAHTEPPRG